MTEMRAIRGQVVPNRDTQSLQGPSRSRRGDLAEDPEGLGEAGRRLRSGQGIGRSPSELDVGRS